MGVYISWQMKHIREVYVYVRAQEVGLDWGRFYLEEINDSISDGTWPKLAIGDKRLIKREIKRSRYWSNFCGGYVKGLRLLDNLNHV